LKKNPRCEIGDKDIRCRSCIGAGKGCYWNGISRNGAVFKSRVLKKLQEEHDDDEESEPERESLLTSQAFPNSAPIFLAVPKASSSSRARSPLRPRLKRSPSPVASSSRNLPSRKRAKITPRQETPPPTAAPQVLQAAFTHNDVILARRYRLRLEDLYNDQRILAATVQFYREKIESLEAPHADL
jgi:hypothetical protein